MIEQKNKVIILAEDEEFLARAYLNVFNHNNLEVIRAKDGEDALEKIKEHKPSLLLLDIIMPKLSGFDVLETMQKDETIQTPTIILSNLGQQNDIDKALALGAKDYIIKANSTPDEVIEVIKKYL